MKAVAVILAGGEGRRLRPLTEIQCKPAVPFAGRYRIIDGAIGNVIRSGFSNVYVLSQFLSDSLEMYLGGFDCNWAGRRLQLVTPKRDSSEEISQNQIYEGTADAVRKNLHRLLSHQTPYVAILSGDQIYSMDLSKMIHFAEQKESDLTIASTYVNARQARQMGVMKIDKNANLVDFLEKPSKERDMRKFSQILSDVKDLSSKNSEKSSYFLGSMGIYLFKRELLIDALSQKDQNDFGKDIVPKLVGKQKGIHSYLFKDYWRDIGTINSYYQAHMEFLERTSSLAIYNRTDQIQRELASLPSARFSNGRVVQSVICEGSVIEAKRIEKSVIGWQTEVGSGTSLENSIILGSLPRSDCPPTQIGKNCRLKRVIVDEGAILEDDVQLINKNREQFYESEDLSIRDGVIVVKSKARIFKGFCL